jgi:mannose/fructose/N-acetylgalactosamine-specific phosphotransferase system component IID/mannose/fructose/N-acetylgalactosamine-specific phosphotransferase system component IIC
MLYITKYLKVLSLILSLLMDPISPLIPALVLGGLAFYFIYDSLTTALFFAWFSPLVASFMTAFVTMAIYHTDPVSALAAAATIGGTLQLAALGLYTYGGASIPDFMSASMIATYYSIAYGISPTTAISIAVPIAVFLIELDVLARTLNVPFIHMADRAVAAGKLWNVRWIAWLGLFPWGFSRFIPVFLGVYFGPVVAHFITTVIPEWVNHGFVAVGHVLPVVGLALLLTYLPTRKYFAFALIGYALAAYLHIPILGIFIILAGLALTYMSIRQEAAKATGGAGSTATDGGAVGEVVAGKPYTKITRKDLLWTYIKGLLHFQVAWNYERMQALDYLYNITHILDKLYPDPEARKRAYQLHLQFYNTNPNTHYIIQGMDIAVEEQRGLDEDAINSVKAGFMGPFAGIGDSLFYTTLDVLILALAASFVLSGIWWAWIAQILYGLFVLIPIRYFFLKWGYEGFTGVARFTETLKYLTELLGMVGVGVVAALIYLYVPVTIPITITTATHTTVSVQSLINTILPGLIPVLFAGFAYWLYTRRISVAKVVGIIFVIAFVLGALGILG